ncbi:SMP-30/gluconolactonase/LRE family protein [Rathayibacter soli]|uniref:SMP-30/gluconolactonase/LRE family protein n=1 Tax=Rathayibacter soli TaxID=3144168 RepID=UPI0027E44821|nr:SMP-30/gluconolactonase/LRE family protein [Glaciibacter superstes]
MVTFESAPATAAEYELAEGPIWDARSATLWWVDIPAGAVIHGRIVAHRRDGQIEELGRTVFGETVGAVGLAADGGLIVAAQRGLATIDLAGRIHHGPPLLAEDADSRMNDGACDPAGRYLVGSLALGTRANGTQTQSAQTVGAQETGSRLSEARPDRELLLRADPSGAVVVLREDIALSNGIAWSPDGRTIYHVDTSPGHIWAADYDASSGAASDWHVLFTVTDGSPDGMVVDAGGALWVAIWGGGQVRRYDTAGTVLAVVTVDAPHVSCPAFAGPDRSTLVISTAKSGLTDGLLKQHPLSGALFIAHPGVSGLPENLWAGSTAAPQWGVRLP